MRLFQDIVILAITGAIVILIKNGIVYLFRKMTGSKKVDIKENETMKRSNGKKSRSGWKTLIISTFGVIIAVFAILYIVGSMYNPLDYIARDHKSEMIQGAINSSNGTITGGDVKVIDDNTIEIDLNLVSGYEDEVDPATIEQALASKDVQDTLEKSMASEAQKHHIKQLNFNYKYIESNGTTFAKATVPLTFD